MLEKVARKLRRPLVFIECGPDDKPLRMSIWRDCDSFVLRCDFYACEEKPVSEEAKRNALAAADVGISLVDNAQETFGLAVAEAMAAGLPMVVSNWSGYRDLVREGVDGYLIPSAWASSASKVSVFWDGNSSLVLRASPLLPVRWHN